jgi:TolB protein
MTAMRIATVERLLLVFLLIAALPGTALAQATVDVIGGEGDRIPIAVLTFGGDEETDQESQIARIVADDFRRSSALKIVDAGGAPMSGGDGAIDFAWFRERQTDMVVAGTVNNKKDSMEAHLVLYDVAGAHAIIEKTLSYRGRNHRRLAHRIADIVHEKLVGYPGAFATRICYVTRSADSAALIIADADGYNRSVLYQSAAPLMSPQWSPDGSKIAYVSFERKRPRIYVHNLDDGSRKVVASFRGTNSAPAWSPDGKRIAATLSKDGGSQIYLMDADGKNLRRLSDSPSRDTEPSFSPDGQHILFTSDRAGSAQIYRIPLAGDARAERMTFDGSYSASPQYSPDGQFFAFVHQQSGGFGIGLQDIATRQTRYLTSGHDDRSPAFAPNGKAILYVTKVKDRGTLAVISTDGFARSEITTYAHDIRSPAWAPYDSHDTEVK